MSKKNGATIETPIEQENQQMLSSVIFDEVLTSSKGWSLRVLVDLARIQDDADRYEDQLRFSRGIPFNLDTLTPFDPLCIYVATNMTWMKSEDVVNAARQHYQKLISEAQRDSIILATIASPDNRLVLDPQPYMEPEDEALPGLVTMPRVKRNLDNPVERRLKQFIDLLSSDPPVMQRFNAAFEKAAVELTRKAAELDPNGFRPQ
jgi:hypothetical protein